MKRFRRLVPTLTALVALAVGPAAYAEVGTPGDRAAAPGRDPPVNPTPRRLRAPLSAPCPGGRIDP